MLDQGVSDQMFVQSLPGVSDKMFVRHAVRRNGLIQLQLDEMGLVQLQLDELAH